MKKSITFIVAVVGAFACSMAQTPIAEPCRDCDTIPGRYDLYYYDQWYNSCMGYITNGYEDEPCFSEQFRLHSPLPVGRDMAKPIKTAEPMRIRGMVALVDYLSTPPYTVSGTEKLPEYLYMWQTGTDGEMRFINSLRWDTVKPHVVELPLKADGSERTYCYAYEVFFDKPVTVTSTLYIAGSTNSNVVENVQTERGPMTVFKYLPTQYCSVEGWVWWNCDAETPEKCTAEGDYRQRVWNPHTSEYSWQDYAPESVFGYFLPIKDAYRLQVAAEDNQMGSTRGGGIYEYGQSGTIEAVAAPGFSFAGWDDGDTNNPRSIYMDRDQSYKALFVPSTDNSSITLSPNPTRNEIELVMDKQADYTIEICDVRGTRVLIHRFEGAESTLDVSDLPTGIYYLRATSADGTRTSSFIKQ